MQAAAIIRKVARNLIEKFRMMFIDCVAGFKSRIAFITDGGLYNPPGISPFNEDPEDDASGDKDG